MLDIGATELLLIVVVAVIVIGPKDLPLALRTAGKWIGKMRRLSNHFRSGLDAMIREAEMEEMEKKWREQNERIKREHPADAPPEAEPTGALPAPSTPAGSTSEQAVTEERRAARSLRASRSDADQMEEGAPPPGSLPEPEPVAAEVSAESAVPAPEPAAAEAGDSPRDNGLPSPPA